jgi:hypothetical protein
LRSRQSLRSSESRSAKRARRLGRRLEKEKVLSGSGAYPQPEGNPAIRSGFRVKLYRAALKLVGKCRSAIGDSPVGTGHVVKPRDWRFSRRRWWQHPLFGDYAGRPPPHLGRQVAKRMRSLDEVPSQAALVASVTAP